MCVCVCVRQREREFKAISIISTQKCGNEKEESNNWHNVCVFVLADLIIICQFVTSSMTKMVHF